MSKLSNWMTRRDKIIFYLRTMASYQTRDTDIKIGIMMDVNIFTSSYKLQRKNEKLYFF